MCIIFLDHWGRSVCKKCDYMAWKREIVVVLHKNKLNTNCINCISSCSLFLLHLVNNFAVDYTTSQHIRQPAQNTRKCKKKCETWQNKVEKIQLCLQHWRASNDSIFNHIFITQSIYVCNSASAFLPPLHYSFIIWQCSMLHAFSFLLIFCISSHLTMKLKDIFICQNYSLETIWK